MQGHKNDKQKLQILHNNCIRYATKPRKYDHISTTFQRLKLNKLEIRREIHLTCFIHNTILTKNPPYLYEKFKFQNNIHNINTQSQNNLVISFYHTEKYKSSLKYNSSIIYNNIHN